MLYWHFRNIQCIIVALFKPRLKDPTQVFKKTFFANPFDSDWMNAIQAGRFFTYTDAARWEIGVRIGFLRPAFKNRWIIISGGQKIIYKRPVKIFRKFQMNIQITGWDDKWIYAAHIFRQDGETKCAVFSKLGFRGHGKLISPQKVFESTGLTATCSPPKWIEDQFSEDLDLLRTATDSLKL